MTHIIWPLTALPDLTTHIKGYSVLLGKFWLILQGMRWFMGWSSNFLEFPNLKVVPILVLFQIIMVSLAKLLALKLVSIISLKFFMLRWYKLVITKLIIWFYKRLCITYRVMLKLWDSEFSWLFSCFLHLEISFFLQNWYGQLTWKLNEAISLKIWIESKQIKMNERKKENQWSFWSFYI